MLCKFDHRETSFKVPYDYIKKEDFDIVHVFVITKPELRNNLITINALGHKIVGCPVIIDDKKYDRNALIFNLCLVFHAETDTEKYEGIVKKLASYLTTLETESGFLSKEDNKQRLYDILTSIIEQLNQGQCSIQINPSTTINLKVICDKPTPVEVSDYDVPILCPDVPRLPTVQPELDLSTQQLLCYIDGYKHVAKIAAEADVDIAIVKACVQNLVYHGVMKMASTFKYSNVYIVTPDISKLYEEQKLQEECIKYVARPGKTPCLRDVFTMYCGLTSGTRVKDLCSRFNTNALGIDEKKLIQFGLLYRFIRHLNKYPVKLPNEAGSARLRTLYTWFDGVHSCDEICCKTGISSQDLEEKIDNDPSVVICWK